ncbi:class I SAM-dependent methyltransferase [Actinokineospora guangxiensis]|uniref:Class I SAM-dependent methyltransferase n=1 Tax=Actinokineospora guangxiensis TaxID=1490288 RepID=A0ABW0EH85_9PSEU
MSGLRTAYVRAVRGTRGIAERSGLLARLGNSASPVLRHVRTLFSIHDVDDLVAQDLAWWSYPAMREVERFLARRADARVFEYGAGASTVWLAKRAARVHSVEHDAEFGRHVAAMVADLPNVELRVVAPTPAGPGSRARSGRAGHEDLAFDDYVDAIEAVGGRFDLIVVDGRARVDSFRRALEHLADDGLIVFDNVRRARYRPAVEAPGLRVRHLRGATPALPYPTTTGLISRG